MPTKGQAAPAERRLEDHVMLAALRALQRGELDVRLPDDLTGLDGEIAEAFNDLCSMASDLTEGAVNMSRYVGDEGRTKKRLSADGLRGDWGRMVASINDMMDSLTERANDIVSVVRAAAAGDLTQRVLEERADDPLRGQFLNDARTVNTMMAQLQSLNSEVTRVALEVGVEGQLGAQARVPGAGGAWRELADSVNIMASGLTAQVRGIARVVTAVANGDLTQRLQLEARGEIATLVETINGMTCTLSVVGAQVTGVARQVGVEGILGGHADVPGAAGVWRDLTDNVNELAGNLTRQVRAIGDVATAVTTGDLTQSIAVEARGEVALLKDNLNLMIGTLAETARVNEQQDWLESNLARFTRMLQGQREMIQVAQQVLGQLAPTVGAQHGAFFVLDQTEEKPALELVASYADNERTSAQNRFLLGEGLVGQAALEHQRILVTDVPSDYIKVTSAMGEASPVNIVVVPILFENEVKGVIELASFQRFDDVQLAFLEQLVESIGIVMATIEAQMRTDGLLRQSQELTEELQTQQEELQQTNEELEEQARHLTAQKSEVEVKNRAVELARSELEEKAEQLLLTSRYKSQFLANMSHELRTPLNSLLILSRQLADNVGDNLTPKQVEYASTIEEAGKDLLQLINEILDLAKIESRTIKLEVAPLEFATLRDYVQQTFGPSAEVDDLELQVELSEELPRSLKTDEMRLKQVLRNLLSNALKFTEKGHVRLEITPSARRDNVVFIVTDTGIGIGGDDRRLIFEAFQQADAGADRKYGGTGLGLSISRELASLLGGSLWLDHSALGKGSRFVLEIPLEHEYKDRPLSLPGSSHSASRSIVQHSPDDRDLEPDGTRSVIIVEDDSACGRMLLEAAHQHGFRGVLAGSGEEAFELAIGRRPDAMTLDLRLAGSDGLVVLDRIKRDVRTRHIPVYVVSGADDARILQRARARGAVACYSKPLEDGELGRLFASITTFLDSEQRFLLIVEDDGAQRNSLEALLGGDPNVAITAVSDAEAALAALDERAYDCMVLDLSLPGMDGFDLLSAIEQRPESRRMPCITYTGAELSRSDETRLQQLAESIIIKDVRSPERLLDETTLFLHRPAADLSDEKRAMLRSLFRADPALNGKKILIVDDDVRNIFAITTLLEPHGLEVVFAENGHEALDRLEKEQDIALVLMDIMMPEMDGYEAMRKIRGEQNRRDLPIIALTAKAMRGVRDACIQAGASDYITKPVEPEQLISLLRVWLYQ